MRSPVLSPRFLVACLASVVALALPARRASGDAIRLLLERVALTHEMHLRQLRPGTTVPWRTSDGREIAMTEWRGVYVSLLTERDDHDPALVKRLLDAIDAFWVRCRETCGNTPPPDPTKGALVKGRAIVAEAVRQPSAHAGPVIGMRGVARVSIGSDALEELLRSFKRGRPSAPLGARLPRAIAHTFVYFESELAAAVPEHFDDLTNALAFLLAGEVEDSLGWLVPADERPFERILAEYRSDPKASLDTTLAQGRSRASPTGSETADAESLWIAIFLAARHSSGEAEFMRRVWTTLSECPPAPDRNIALGNLVVAFSAGSRANLVGFFRELRFPVDEATSARAAEALAPRKLDVHRAKPAKR